MSNSSNALTILPKSSVSRRHLAVGLLLMAFFIGSGFYWWFLSPSPLAFSKLSQAIASSWTSSHRLVRLEAANGLDCQVGDSVFAYHRNQWALVGSVRSVQSLKNVQQIEIAWTHPTWFPRNDQEWEHYQTPQSMAWVAQVMLPQDKLKKLSDELVLRFRQRQSELASEFEPVIVQTFRDLLPEVEERFRQSLLEQKVAIDGVVDRYQSELVEKKIVPMIRTEVMPIVQRRSQALVNTIGEELFDRVSVWSFTWRYLYDALPLTERDLVKSEFERFVQEDAIPIFESHLDEIVAVFRTIAIDLEENPKIRALFQSAASEMFHDPELRGIFSQSMHDVFDDTESLKALIRKNWESENGTQLAGTLEQLIDPWLRNVGAELFGTPEDGLTKEFVAVLRSQVLAKDQTWIVAPVMESPDVHSHPSSKPASLVSGHGFPLYPLLIDQSEAKP